MAKINPSAAAGTAAALARPGKTLGQRIMDNWQLYLLLLVPVVLTFVYKYIPMYGIQIAWETMSDSLAEQVNIRITGGQLPDAFMGVGFSNYDLARYGDDGTFLDLTPYLTPDIMPNLCVILEEHPGGYHPGGRQDLWPARRGADDHRRHRRAYGGGVLHLLCASVQHDQQGVAGRSGAGGAHLSG